MWLTLPLDATWRVTAAADLRRASSPALPGVTLEWGPLVLAPEEPRPWVDAVLGAGLPAGARIEGSGVEVAQTASGWPVTIIEARVVASEETVELRIAGFYTFLAHAAHALARTADLAGYAQARTGLRDLLAGGAPDFSSGLAAVEEFWGDPEPARAEPPAAAELPAEPLRPGSDVVDEFEMFGWRFATHRPRPDPARPFADPCRFTVSDRGGRPLDVQVRIETSDVALARGTPFVVSVTHRGAYRVVDTLDALPPYPALRVLVGQIVAGIISRPTTGPG